MSFPNRTEDWGIRYQGDLERIKRDLSTFFFRVTPSLPAVQNSAKYCVNTIVDRTRKGKDVDGRKFIPYKEKYKKFRQKKGKSGTTNLAFSEEMLQSVKYEVTQQGSGLITIIVFIEGKENEVKAWVHDIGAISGRQRARFRMAMRHWFGLSRKEVSVLESKIQLEIMRLAREVFRG